MCLGHTAGHMGLSRGPVKMTPVGGGSPVSVEAIFSFSIEALWNNIVPVTGLYTGRWGDGAGDTYR